MGAKITGVGSNRLYVEGVEYLGGTEHRMLPDMIEIGSFIGLAAMTQSEITIKDCRLDMLGNILAVFEKLELKWNTEEMIFISLRATISKFSDLLMARYLPLPMVHGQCLHRTCFQ